MVHDCQLKMLEFRSRALSPRKVRQLPSILRSCVDL